MTNEPNGIGPVVILIALSVGYFLPSIIASWRRCRRANGVFVVNMFLGWTLLGWVLSLAWAVSGDQLVKPTVEHPPSVSRDKVAAGITIAVLLVGFLGLWLGH